MYKYSYLMYKNRSGAAGESKGLTRFFCAIMDKNLYPAKNKPARTGKNCAKFRLHNIQSRCIIINTWQKITGESRMGE